MNADSAKLKSIEAENFCNITKLHIEIPENNNLIKITGKNNNGKTNTLNIIAACMDKSLCPAKPLKDG